MKKLYWCTLLACFFMVMHMGLYVMKNPFDKTYITRLPYFNTTDPLKWISATAGAPPSPLNPENISTVIISAEDQASIFLAPKNLLEEEGSSLLVWNHLRHLLLNANALPNAANAIKEAGSAWKLLVSSIEEEVLQRNDGSRKEGEEKKCPHFISKINASQGAGSSFKFRVPCGLTQGSSITFIAIPNSPLGNFRVDLTGEPLPGEPDPPIILHYNVRLLGDALTEDPVIVQNTWTAARDWGEEQRCPSDPNKSNKVDALEQCNEMVGKEINTTHKSPQHFNGSTLLSDGNPMKYFPFRENDLFVATLRVGSEGIQMTVDGKHVTSFAFRETLEPWLVSQVRISGDIGLMSVVASGLPTSEDLEHNIDLASLKAAPLSWTKKLDLFIGVFSTANNFKRRMSVRRSWMQYPDVRSGRVAVRFFVGLHKNQMVNEELWDEAKTYEDIQLMPFVDYYNLITLKTIGICILGSDVVTSKFVMKTDDDSFVRVDEILNSIKRTNVTHGLVYGSIDAESHPSRDPSSKWYVSLEEWSEASYPPWPHGPGYIVSHDIARMVSKNFRKGRLKMFKLEDVAIGTWVASMKKGGMNATFVNDGRIFSGGCKDGYVVAHYQGPRELLCLWHKLLEKKRPECCGGS